MIRFLARYVSTAIYAGCVAVIMLIVSGQLAVVAGMVTIAGLILVATLLAEVHSVHVLVNGRYDALLEEIGRLRTMLGERREP